MFLDDRKRVAPHRADRDAVHENSDVIQRHAPSGSDRLIHGVGILGLNADDLYFGQNGFHVGADTRNQSATADRDEDCRQDPGAAAEEFRPQSCPGRQ